MACEWKRVISIILTIFVLAAGGLASYFIWYRINYKYNIADRIESIKFSESDYEVQVIWQRDDHLCRAEIYKGGRYFRHAIDLGRWFTINKNGDNSILLVSGSGRDMLISLDEDSPNFMSIVLMTWNGYDNSCIRFKSNNVNWYGGPQDPNQLYPAQNLIYCKLPFVTTETRRTVERYWVASDGFFILVNYYTNLFVDSGMKCGEDVPSDQLCLHSLYQPPYSLLAAPTPTPEEFRIGLGSNIKDTHVNVVTKYLGKPQSIPNERMIHNPIWNTKVRFPYGINETIIRSYANEIILNGFTPNTIDIDGIWESCQGSLLVDLEKFPDMSSLIATLKSQGFNVRLSVHPFISSDCEPFFSEAVNNNFTVQSSLFHFDSLTAHVDFTNSESINWFGNRLKSLQEFYGVDSFKFDGGESNVLPLYPQLHGDESLLPNLITQSYVKFATSFGDMASVRTAWASQNLSIWLRMSEFDSNWNSMKEIIPRLLQLNMNGYGFLQSDMSGGNQIHNDKELYIRWLQISVFIPSIQFSVAPWDFDQDTITIARNLVELHNRFANLILERLNLAVVNGVPVNPPIWWLDPQDSLAQIIDDEFLLGETILVAPLIEKGAAKRDIYLPTGEWEDGNTGNYFTGPQWIREYPVPLHMIPFFIKVN